MYIQNRRGGSKSKAVARFNFIRFEMFEARNRLLFIY